MRIEISDIKLKKGSNFCLEIPSLIINQGELVAISGESGAGKSTLLDLISALEIPEKGDVFYGGLSTRSKSGVRKVREDISYVFQTPENNFFSKTVYEEILFPDKLTRKNYPSMTLRLKNILSEVELKEDVLEKSPFNLSGGEKRKVALATALIKTPKILLLDEPFSSLDPESRVFLLQKIKGLSKKGMTVITVTHNSDILSQMDRVILLKEGKVGYSGKPDNILSSRYKCYDYSINIPKVTEISEALFMKGYNVKITSKEDELIKEILALKEEKNSD